MVADLAESSRSAWRNSEFASSRALASAAVTVALTSCATCSNEIACSSLLVSGAKRSHIGARCNMWMGGSENSVKFSVVTGELGRMPRVRSAFEPVAVRSATEPKGEAAVVLSVAEGAGDPSLTADVTVGTAVVELVPLRALGVDEGAVEDILSGARSGAAGEISQGGYGGPRERGR